MRANTHARISQAVAAATWLVALVFTVSLARFTLGHSYFIGDDFSTMWRLRTLSFHDLLLYPLGGQIVPLHRLVAWAVDAAAPMNFTAAWAVLLGSHLVGVFYLHRILELLRPSAANPALLALYCVHPLLGAHLSWFSSGLTRLPFIALSLAALHAFLRHRSDPRVGHLIATSAAFVLALGFYSKGILVPLYLVTLELLLFALAEEDERVRRGRSARLACAGVLLLCAIAYVLGARALLGAGATRINIDPAFHYPHQYLSLLVTLHAVLGRILEFDPFTPSWIVPVVFPTAIVLTLWFRPRAGLAWLALLALVSANFALIGASQRSLLYGALLAFEHRYHFEVMFLIVLCMGIAVHATEGRFQVLSGRQRWLPLATRLASLALIVAVATQSHREFTRSTSATYADLPRARAFVTTLLADAGRLVGAKGVVVADAEFPRYLDWMDLELKWYSQLLPALGVGHLAFGRKGDSTHIIDAAGHVVPRRR